MKKTLYLAMVFGLTSAGALAADEPSTKTVIWDGLTHTQNDGTDTLAYGTIGNFNFKNVKINNNSVDIPVLRLDWKKVENGETVRNTETVDLGSITITNEKTGQYNPATASFGILELADNTSTKMSAYTQHEATKHHYIGSLVMEEGAELIIDQRRLTVTNPFGVSLAAGARITLAERTNNNSGVLSLGASDEEYWPSIALSGADKGNGYVYNESEETAILGSPSASKVVYDSVTVEVRGTKADLKNTAIVATLKNANIINASAGGTVTVSGPVVAEVNSVKQISTGKGTLAEGDTNAKKGGDVVLLNRGTDSLKMEAMYIGENHTITARTGDIDSPESVIEMQAYDANKAAKSDLSDAYALTAQSFAALDADLILGTGDISTTTCYWSTVVISDYGKTDMNQGFGLNMMGNDLTLNTGITLGWQFKLHETTTKEEEALLFTNVDSLTLGLTKYQNEYFDYTAGIAAADYFSSEFDVSSISDYETSLEQPVNGVGWYIEYRDNNKGDGTGDVYLAYRPATAQDNVPEPTTATLSLLALAGLAARRRRK